jgi:hypothetical protein
LEKRNLSLGREFQKEKRILNLFFFSSFREWENVLYRKKEIRAYFSRIRDC